jgi:hypothetical protein
MVKHFWILVPPFDEVGFVDKDLVETKGKKENCHNQLTELNDSRSKTVRQGAELDELHKAQGNVP